MLVNVPRISDQIIEKMKTDLAEHEILAKSREKEFQTIYDKLSKDELDEKISVENCNKIIKGLLRLKKKPVNLYLTNWAKLNIYDERLFDITGEFKMWKEKREEIDVIQKQLLDVAETFNNTIKTVIKIRDILKQKGGKHDGKN